MKHGMMSDENMLLDANIFLEVFLDQEKAESCKVLLNEIAAGEKKAIISTFTIDSIIISLESHKVNYNKINSIIESIMQSRGVIVYRPTLKDRFSSFQLINKYKIGYEDALTLQCALVNNCKKIISFDHHFDKIKEIQRCEP